MIVKLGESLRWMPYKRRSRVVMAFRMNEDFLYETTHGWVQGHKGQWLVEIGSNLRCNLDHFSFIKCYKPAERRRKKHHEP